MILDNREKLLEFIKKSSKPLIVIPENSSGDTISGALALFWAFKKNNKNPRLSCSNKIPQKFSFLSGYNLIQQNISDSSFYEISLEIGNEIIEEPQFKSLKLNNQVKFRFRSKNCSISEKSAEFKPRHFEYDSIFSIGSPSLKSLGLIYAKNPNVFSNLPTANIDNQSSNRYFGNINLVDSNCASICEIIARVIEESPDLEIDSEIATLLLTGIIEKTENFQIPSVDGELFYLTAYLLALGARRNETIKYLYEADLFSKKDLIVRKIQNLFASHKNNLLGIKNLKDLDQLKLKQLLIIFLVLTISGTILLNAPKINQNYVKNALSFPNYTPSSISSILNKESIQEENNKNIIINYEEPEEILPETSSDDSNLTAQISSESQEIGTSLTINDSSEISLPKKLEIPKLKVSAIVENVGLTSDNNMDIPKSDWSVGWFSLGPKPGEVGSAVIAGHLDGQNGKPAIFWNLNQLQTGDYIFIIDDNGNKKRFRVIDSEQYDTKNAPMKKIFGAQDDSYLNLITCNGAWNKQERNYDKRLVVFAKYDPE